MTDQSPGIFSSLANSAKTTFESTTPQQVTLVDINLNIAKTVEKKEGEEGKFWKGLTKAAASKTTHEEELPEFAPLMFPCLNEISEADTQSSINKKGAFLADCYDQRGQHKVSRSIIATASMRMLLREMNG